MSLTGTGMGWWLLQQTISVFPLLSPELFLRLILFTTNDYNLSIFTTKANVNSIDTPATEISPPQN